MSDKGKNKEVANRKGSISGSSSSKSGGGKKKDRLVEKMNKITDWLSTSEPSANALKQHKKEAFQKAGISPDDAEANAKLHAPIGQIPPEAIKPAAGPSPEEIVRRKAEQRRRMKEKHDKEKDKDKDKEKDRERHRGGRKHSSTSASASASMSASFSGGSSLIQTPSLSGYSSSMSGPDSSMYYTGDDDFGANGWGPRQV